MDEQYQEEPKIKSTFYTGLAIVITVVGLLILFQVFDFSDYLMNYNDSFTSNGKINQENLSKYSAIGNVIGGIVGTIFALAGTIMLYATFKQQQENYLKERFESKFFEMLRLHKENVNEMKIEGYEPMTSLINIGLYDVINQGDDFLTQNLDHSQIVKKEIIGRKVFVTTFYELKACYEICKNSLSLDEIPDKGRYLIKMAYKLLYSGVGINCPQFIDPLIKDDKIFLAKCVTNLKTAKKEHFTSGGTKNLFIMPNTDVEVKLHLKYKPFSGHASKFGHYYRHIFETVKYAVEQENDLLSYIEVRKFLKILRAQMSDHEQLMIYYNYLSGLGKNWENKTNKYFSRYRMIHNIPLNLATLGVYIEDEFANEIDSIHKEGIKTGINSEMFEQLEP